VTVVTASRFGRFAERVIGARYQAFTGRSSVFPASLSDFQDFSAGFGNVTLWLSFVAANNGSVTPAELARMRRFRHLIRVPDIATHLAPVFEFYEIKPNSPDGLAAGLAKTTALLAFCAFFLLPYSAGTRWRPNERILLWSGMALGHPVRVEFHFFRFSSGLIVYELCLEGELGELALEVIIAILAAIIAILLLRGLRNLPGGSPAPVPLIA
jgi:hypothetical protein